MIVLGVRYNPTQIQMVALISQHLLLSIHLISSLASHDWDIGGSFTESEIQCDSYLNLIVIQINLQIKLINMNING